MNFDKRQSNITKGVATLLLLFHHVFYYNDRTASSITPLLSLNGEPLVCIVSQLCKVCVALFCLVSGLGMYKSFSSFDSQNRLNGKLKFTKQAGFVKNHLLNMMSRYWFIYILFGVFGILIDASRFGLYEGSVINGVIDFFGLSYLFSTPTLNATWWFMFAIIILYLIFPLIYKLFSYSPELTLVLSLAALLSPMVSNQYYSIVLNFQVCQFSFILGMYISRYNILERITLKLSSPVKSIFVCAIVLMLFAYIGLRTVYVYRYKLDGFFSLAIALTSFALLSRIPVLNKILEELGKYSAIIFMSHTFIYAYYFRSFIYWFKYPAIIFIVLVVISYTVARLVDLLMKLTRYNKLFERMTTKRSNT